VLKSGKLRPYFTALAFVASALWSHAGSAQDAVGSLTGVIKDAAGAPVAGAFVQMKNAERRLNFMVITQAEGKYANSRLPAGKYVVQAIGGEQQSAPSAPVEVAAGKFASVDLSLTVARAPALPPAWPGRAPGDRGEEADAATGAAARRRRQGHHPGEMHGLPRHAADRPVTRRAGTLATGDRHHEALCAGFDAGKVPHR
jgi:Carboxypeptidase regulatory-like domain